MIIDFNSNKQNITDRPGTPVFGSDGISDDIGGWGLYPESFIIPEFFINNSLVKT